MLFFLDHSGWAGEGRARGRPSPTEPSVGSAKWLVQGLLVPRTEGVSASPGAVEGRDRCGVTHRSQHPADRQGLPPGVGPPRWRLGSCRVRLARCRRRWTHDGKTAPRAPRPCCVPPRAASPGPAPRPELSLSSWRCHVEPPERPPQGSQPCWPGGPPGQAWPWRPDVTDGARSGPCRLWVPGTASDSPGGRWVLGLTSEHTARVRCKAGCGTPSPENPGPAPEWPAREQHIDGAGRRRPRPAWGSQPRGLLAWLWGHVLSWGGTPERAQPGEAQTEPARHCPGPRPHPQDPVP